MIALDTCLTALTAFQPRHLFACAMQLLNLPAEAARLLCRLRRVLSQVVGHDVVRAVGGDRDPESSHLMVFGEALDLDPLAAREFRLRPR